MKLCTWRAFLDPPEKISNPKNYSTCTKFVTKNSIFNNFERKKHLKFSKIKKHIELVCEQPAICRKGIRRLLVGPESSLAAAEDPVSID